MKSATRTSEARPKRFWGVALLLLFVLLMFFGKSFVPGYVHFANDGPLGQEMTTWSQLPGVFTGGWDDLNSIGSYAGAAAVSPNNLIRWLLGPVGYAKFLVPIALLTLGVGAWAFFRQLRLAPLAVALGALAAMLSSTFFSNACWGVAPQELGVGMDFIALALVISIQPAMPMLDRWVRIVLAGLAVGINMMEAADIGGLFSMLIAAFVVYHAVMAGEGNLVTNFARGVGRVVVIAVCAALIAAYTLSSIFVTQIKGVVGTKQNPQTKQQHWDFATQWSLPKTETLGLVIPGVFGYRMDSPDGGNYWGGVGREPAWDRWYDNGQKGPAPQGIMRFSGGGNYLGVLAVLVALWAAAQSLRGSKSVFLPVERKLLWFWTAAVPVTLLLAYGRFAPFYQIIYPLPYFSTIRNPAKFLNLLSFAVAVLFAYGLHGLSRRYLEPALAAVPASTNRLKKWWADASRFEKLWTFGSFAAIGLGLLGWQVYASNRPALERYLELVGLGQLAPQISEFSIRQVGWFILYLAAAVVVITLVFTGTLAGRRAKWAGVLLGLVLIADLARANLPWVVYWNYPQKYETYGPNPIVQFLREKSYEHRVALLPEWFLNLFQLREEMAQAVEKMNGLYTIEWNQQLFPYYNIQTLDIIQRPRTQEDIATYEMALAFQSPETLRNVARRWELTNTRYLLGFVGFLDPLNNYFDPESKRFRVVERFDIVPKPGVTNPTQWQDMTAQPSINGAYAVFEFTGALPRLKLYANWQRAADDQAAVNDLNSKPMAAADLDFLHQLGTNDYLTLKKLASPSFDPQQTVLLASPIPPSTNTGSAAKNLGTVEFTRYAPKDIKLHAQSEVPSILLLNDKYDPSWQVWVDGKRAELLRCNFIMRGVYLPAGSHAVEFVFRPSFDPLYVNVGAFGAGIVLIGLALFRKGKSPTPTQAPSRQPVPEKLARK